MINKVEKETLEERFHAFLDTRLDTDLDAAGHIGLTETDQEEPDLYSLFAEVAGLKAEVKLESRQLKTAVDDFREVFDTLRQTNDRLSNELAARRTDESQIKQDAERNLLLDLLDLRDRLAAGSEQANTYQPPKASGSVSNWFGKGKGRHEEKFIQGMAEGLSMNLRRLDEVLAQHNVRALPAKGMAFDPTTMHAVETKQRLDRKEGEVLIETRQGFLQQDRLLRAAEVIVNKKGE